MLYVVKTVSSKSNKEPKKPLDMAFFVIKKKVFKKAADRNRVKRRARKAFLDAISSIQQHNPSFSVSALLPKKIIFFLERDMIQHVYSDIVSKMSEDLTKIIKN